MGAFTVTLAGTHVLESTLPCASAVRAASVGEPCENKFLPQGAGQLGYPALRGFTYSWSIMVFHPRRSVICQRNLSPCQKHPQPLKFPKAVHQVGIL